MHLRRREDLQRLDEARRLRARVLDGDDDGHLTGERAFAHCRAARVFWAHEPRRLRHDAVAHHHDDGHEEADLIQQQAERQHGERRQQHARLERGGGDIGLYALIAHATLDRATFALEDATHSRLDRVEPLVSRHVDSALRHVRNVVASLAHGRMHGHSAWLGDRRQEREDSVRQ